MVKGRGFRTLAVGKGFAIALHFRPMLGLRLAAGRWFLPEEDAPDRRPVVVLSDGFWRRRFGGDSQVLGRTMMLNDRPHEIVRRTGDDPESALGCDAGWRFFRAA